MKRFKRIASFLLLMCMVVSFVPPIQIAKAAETVYRYELDTDGIDPGATYLIVNTATAGTGHALRFYYQNNNQRDLRDQELTVRSEDGVTYINTGFTNETNCQFQFSSATSGKITHGDYAVDLANARYITGNPTTLNFTNMGNGQYRIHYSQWFSSYYLTYSNSDWVRGSRNTAYTVYLYKLTDYVVHHDITFHGNGYTSGKLPQDALGLEKDSEYILPDPQEELRKDVGNDTWLFLGWNTKSDGTGTEYKPGDKIIVTEDLVLYADWYLQNKHTISMITYMDGVKTDVDKFAGYDRQFFAQLEGNDTFIPMEKTDEGTYSARVVENGTYLIYAITQDGEYSPVHGHKIAVYNQDGITECMHYSITHDPAGGVWAEGAEPTETKCHNGEAVIAHDQIPTRDGYRFLGWMDQATGKTYLPGHEVTHSADRPVVLTAVWEDLVNVTVTVVIDHKAEGGGVDGESSRHDVILYLLREENGVNLPVEERVLTSGYVYDEENETTTYTVVFTNLPQGVYRVTSIQDSYADTVTYSGNANEDQTIRVDSKYVPDEKNLTFNVVVNADNAAEMALMPIAVNVKIVSWHSKNGVQDWHIITQQAGDALPSTVMIDENGRGTASYTVWGKRSGNGLPYEYRVVVTSVVLPNGTIVHTSGDLVTYTPDGSGLYEATVSVEGAGRVPTYPAESNTTLTGAYFVDQQQMGVPTVTVEINPMTVTFDAGSGTVNGQQMLVMENQFLYPALHDYVAVSNDAEKVFIGWVDAQGNMMTNQEFQLLEGNVTYYARYRENITLSGEVKVEASYIQDGQTVQISEEDRAKKVLVVLQKKVGDAFNDMDSVVVNLVYQKNSAGQLTYGLGEYSFTNLPNDGTEYRIHVLVTNYDSTYDNNNNQVYTQGEAVARIDELTAQGRVDAYLSFAPVSYNQSILVDVSLIQQELRPTDVQIQVLYRDLGDIYPYQVISQHTVAPFGNKIAIDATQAGGITSVPVWNTHTNGTPYEYQMQVSTVYGNNVQGAYMKDGTPYTSNSPYYVEYGPANNYLREGVEGGAALTATLIPKEYPVYLDLNPMGEEDRYTPVTGLEKYAIDDGSGEEKYAFMHTWSYAEQFTANPYKAGYVFEGWESPNNDEVYIKDGTIYVGTNLNHAITLKAKWRKLSGTDYTIRYMEHHTDKVLKTATVVSGSAVGTQVVAAINAPAIEGYAYVGAAVDGNFIDMVNNPVMTVTNNPAENLLIIYYRPDNGYTDQVESNVEINKYATLQDDGTYTITLDTFTKDSPITTLIQQNTPMDIVLVLDQSGSIHSNIGMYNVLDDLQNSVESFITMVSQHGSANAVDHRIAIVGYASNGDGGYNSSKPTAGVDPGGYWANTGVFDSHGAFHTYTVTGFNYTEYIDAVNKNGVYYTKSGGEYLLLTYHETYYHLITEDAARQAFISGTTVYGYVDGWPVELTRNSSGLWLYGDKLLYSAKEFYTYHTDVWTHRNGLGPREIHAYGTGADYREVDGHKGVYTRTETRDANPEVSIYKDALVPVSLGVNGYGDITPGLLAAPKKLGGNGKTYVSYGMEMANNIFRTYQETEGDQDRLRIVVVFTDGKPGDNVVFDDDEANKAIMYSNNLSNEFGAKVFTVGLYGSDVPDHESEQDFFMNGLSSNYPNAQSLDDVWAGVGYHEVTGQPYMNSSGPYFVEVNGEHHKLHWHYKQVKENNRTVTYICWGYGDENGSDHVEISVTKYDYTATGLGHPQIIDSMVNGYKIHFRHGDGYKAADATGYYKAIYNETELIQYFNNVLKDITTKITTTVELESDTILRDIMGQGLVLTPDTVITAYVQAGEYNTTTGSIDWSNTLIPVAQAVVPEKLKEDQEIVTSVKIPTDIEDFNSNVVINIYNLKAANPSDPNGDDYHPHTVDITGYDYEKWYISEKHTKGYKLVTTITRIEARDDVEWGVSTATNHAQSGLWLPTGAGGTRQLLLAFDQPTTIFVERAYVLDYGKEFTLSGWYFDDEDGKNANPIHIDCDITNGMNWFDPANPNTTNYVPQMDENGEYDDPRYGNTKYGNVQLKDGKVVYSPTTMNWKGYDQFYVFGNTWRKTVVAQDANENGNLWNKVTVIPANNIYYEDSFVTTADSTQNGIEGFTFTGAWSVVGSGNNNTEHPEHMEDATYGDVHGWTDSLKDDNTYTDGTAHITGTNGERGAKVEFTFTGTGVEVYTSTNAKSGMAVAVLTRKITTDDNRVITQHYKTLIIDNLAASNGNTGYYHVPTVAFKALPYGTYTLQLTATSASSNGNLRYEYVIDGVRIHNPLGNAANYHSDVVQDAYGLETNAVFTEVRDILLSYKDFNAEITDGTDGQMGAVFIDQLMEGQGSENDVIDVGVPTYNIGTYEKFGPKNEVYLSKGQAIVLKVDESNSYYVGLKSLTGAEVTVNVSGINLADPTTITLTHTTDMYYHVTPIGGYIVIQNGNTDDAILSITNLRTTNFTAPAENGGVLPVAQQEAIALINEFTVYLQEKQNNPQPDETDEYIPTAQEQALANEQMAAALFTSVRQWLDTE